MENEMNVHRIVDTLSDLKHREFVIALFMVERGIDEEEAANMYEFYMESDYSLFNFLEYYENK